MEKIQTSKQDLKKCICDKNWEGTSQILKAIKHPFLSHQGLSEEEIDMALEIFEQAVAKVAAGDAKP